MKENLSESDPITEEARGPAVATMDSPPQQKKTVFVQRQGNILWPAITTFAISFLVGWLTGGSAFDPKVVFSNLVVAQIFAYITYLIFVKRKQKSVNHVWINYSIWCVLCVLRFLQDAGIILK